MMQFLGSGIILVACVIISNNLTRKAEITLSVTEALVSFVAFVGTSIKTLKQPLNLIYKEFNNEHLFNVGFLKKINEEDLFSAIKTLETIITKESYNALIFMEEHIGGIDIETQCNLCDVTEKSLQNELNKLKQTYKEKKRMYQLLPILCGLSLIILIV